ncbi:MAG: FAD-dependent oxidoreductase [Nocardia sp.]|nr:FAD-dependent oxidoreductase [Nocardia sp.]
MVGAGFTGLEVATELVGRLADPALAAESAGPPRVVLAERAETVAPDLGPGPRPAIEEALAKLGVEVRLGRSIASVNRVSSGSPTVPGKYAGYHAADDLLGLPLASFTPAPYAMCVDLGAAGAVSTSGWERTVVSTGDAAKQRKTTTNRERIHPRSAMPRNSCGSPIIRSECGLRRRDLIPAVGKGGPRRTHHQ